MITKTQLLKQIENLPSKFTIDELVEKLIFINKIEEGLKDSKDNNKISESELDLKMKAWFA